MLSLFASDAVKKILAALLMLAGGLAAHLPDGIAKTISTYIALVLGAGGILSGGLASLQPPIQALVTADLPAPTHFQLPRP